MARIMGVAESWASLERAVIPRDASPVQRTEMRRAFYAGAWSVLCALRTISDDATSEAEGVATLEAMVAECEAFHARLDSGEA